MNDQDRTTDNLSDAEAADVLAVAIQPRDVFAEFQGLMGLSEEFLLRQVRSELKDLDLSWADAAKLLGVTEDTLRRWRRTKRRPKIVTPKMVVLYLLLSLAVTEGSNSRAANLVRLAICTLRNEPGPEENADLDDNIEAIQRSVFGVSGLMAAAFYLSLMSEAPQTKQQSGP